MRLSCLGALVIAGCSEPVPERVEYDDVARIVAATIATSDHGGTLGAINDSIVLAFGGMPSGFTYEDGMVAGDHGTVQHQYLMIECRDRENRLLKPCMSLTDAATLIARWSGSLDRSGLHVRSNRQGMWTLANLQTWVPTINGSSELQVTGTVDERRYELTANQVETMLAPSAMMGGAIELDLVVSRGTDEPEPAIEAYVVFDASLRSASLTMDGEHVYRIDLADGDVGTTRER